MCGKHSAHIKYKIIPKLKRCRRNLIIRFLLPQYYYIQLIQLYFFCLKPMSHQSACLCEWVEKLSNFPRHLQIHVSACACRIFTKESLDFYFRRKQWTCSIIGAANQNKLCWNSDRCSVRNRKEIKTTGVHTHTQIRKRTTQQKSYRVVKRNRDEWAKARQKYLKNKRLTSAKKKNWVARANHSNEEWKKKSLLASTVSLSTLQIHVWQN